MAEIPLEAEAAAAPAPAEPVRAVSPAPSRRPLVKRHHGIVRLAHWANAVLLLGMIASGLQIYMAFTHFGLRGRPYLPEPVGRQAVPALVPPRRLAGRRAQLALRPRLAVRAHRAGLPRLSGVSGEWRSLLFRPSDVPRAVQMQLYYLRLRREHPPQGKHNALQKLAYTSIVLLGALSVLTGFAVYKPVAARAG